MGGRSSRQKGNSWERAFVQACTDAGVGAQRVPHSGAMPGYPDDVVLTDFAEPGRRVEVKYRAKADGWLSLYRWLGSADALLLPASSLVVLRFDIWAQLAQHRLQLGSWVRFDEPGAPRTLVQVKNCTPRTQLLQWLGDADALALRRSWAGLKHRERVGWLVCERLLPRAPEPCKDDTDTSAQLGMFGGQP